MEELLDSQSFEREYVRASKGKRFANYLIDVIGYYIFALIVGVLLGGVLLSAGNEEFLLNEETSIGQTVLEWVFGIIVIILYYTASEYFFKGKTLGKLITRTRAVTLTNERMDFSTTLKRTLCRIVPFEQFSFLGDQATGWHDTWSDTKVIEDRNWEEYV